MAQSEKVIDETSLYRMIVEIIGIHFIFLSSFILRRNRIIPPLLVSVPMSLFQNCYLNYY